MGYIEITPQQAVTRYLNRDEEEGEKVVILDVRTPREWVSGHIPGAVHIPLDELTSRYQDLDPDRETLVVCAHGIRSAAACQWLAQIGFEKVRNMRHGMCAWDGPVEVGP